MGPAQKRKLRRESRRIEASAAARNGDAEALAEGNPTISGLVAKLAEVRRHVVAQVAALDRDIRRLVRSEPVLRRFLTVPGVGPITAVAFLSAIDDPGRFRHARDVGPYLGLTPTRHQSGETDRHGRISKCGDAFTRACLYEAANVPGISSPPA